MVDTTPFVLFHTFNGGALFIFPTSASKTKSRNRMKSKQTRAQQHILNKFAKKKKKANVVVVKSNKKANVSQQTRLHPINGGRNSSSKLKVVSTISNSSSGQASNSHHQEIVMNERFVASIILSASGDAIGYKNGEFEFNFSTRSILNQVKEMGGLSNIDVKGWLVSDDTVMHLHTLRALVKVFSDNDISSMLGAEQQTLSSEVLLNKLMPVMAQEYIDSFNDMDNRGAGISCASGVRDLKRNGVTNWKNVKYSSSGGGCGGSMRAMGIGLVLFGEELRDLLVAVSIESGRLTHNHPTGFLGAMVSAAFTAFAIEGIATHHWSFYLMSDLIPRAKLYLEKDGRDWDKISDIQAFINQWNKYLKSRCLERKDNNGPQFPQVYGIDERDTFYKDFSYAGWPGASGDDSVIIAYDALLGAGDSWEELITRSALHGGDSDSTGAIAAAWWGAIHGFKSVPSKHFKRIEKRQELTDLACQLFGLRRASFTVGNSESEKSK